MPEDLQKVWEAIRDLTERLDRIEARMGRPASEPGPTRDSSPETAPPAVGPPLPALVPGGLLPLLGRTLIVLGGGFLLRAVTDSGALPGRAGVAAGLLYAALWLVLCDVAAGKGDRVGASFHGAAAVALAFPLIVEATLRFQLLSGVGGGRVVLASGLAALAVGRHRRLPVVAWLGVLLAAIAAVVLLVATRELLPLTLVLLALALAIEAVAIPEWISGLRWVAAAAADMAVLVLTVVASREGGPPEGYPPLPTGEVVLAGLALPALYVVSAATRVLGGRGRVGGFELIQTVAALLLGFATAARALAAAGLSTDPLGWAALALGVLAYLAAFGVIDRRAGQPGAFYAATSLALILVLGGGVAVLGEGGRVIAWGLLGLAAVAVGRRFGRRTLRMQGALYLMAGAAAGGVLLAAREGLVGALKEEPPSLGAWALVSFGALLAGAVVLLRERASAGERLVVRLPRLLLLAVLALVTAGLVAHPVMRWAAAAGDGAWRSALAAAARTLVLSALALGLAWLSRRLHLAEARVLVYPVLAVAGLKLVLEDFVQGRPLTLFLGLAIFGAALVGVPRLMARGE